MGGCPDASCMQRHRSVSMQVITIKVWAIPLQGFPGCSRRAGLLQSSISGAWHTVKGQGLATTIVPPSSRYPKAPHHSGALDASSCGLFSNRAVNHWWNQTRCVCDHIGERGLQLCLVEVYIYISCSIPKVAQLFYCSEHVVGISHPFQNSKFL